MTSFTSLIMYIIIKIIELSWRHAEQEKDKAIIHPNWIIFSVVFNFYIIRGQIAFFEEMNNISLERIPPNANQPSKDQT